MYKSQLLSYLEYRTAAIYHACDSILAPLDKFQVRFLNELGISAGDALFHCNLAPLQCRRDMAMLGVLHRTALGKGPDHFQYFFQVSRADRHFTRFGSCRHNRQLVDIKDKHFLEIERKNHLDSYGYTIGFLLKSFFTTQSRGYKQRYKSCSSNDWYQAAMIGTVLIRHAYVHMRTHYDRSCAA